MAGLSMGGMQTRSITLANLDKFSHIGIFSGGSISTNDITDLEAFKQKVKLVFVGYGSREIGGNRPGGNRGGFGGDPKANVEALKAAGINSVWYVSPETAHEWQSWRRSLYQFRAIGVPETDGNAFMNGIIARLVIVGLTCLAATFKTVARPRKLRAPKEAVLSPLANIEIYLPRSASRRQKSAKELTARSSSCSTATRRTRRFYYESGSNSNGPAGLPHGHQTQ